MTRRFSAKKLQTKIFVPILLILLIFPVFTWTAFSFTANNYFRRMAERNTNRLAQQVRSNIREWDPESRTNRPLSDTIRREWIPKLDITSPDSSSKTSLLVIGSDFALTFPEAADVSDPLQELYEECCRRIQENSLSAQETLPLKLSSRSFMIRLLESPSTQPTSLKYVVCYSTVPDTASLLSSTWKLLIAVTALCLALAAVLIWFITRGITRPLNHLCRKAHEIGKGDYSPILSCFQAEELENLKVSINQMAENLRQSEENTIAFFQNASHDLKTPLASISGYAQGIQCGVFEDSRQAAGIILSESQRMTQLVESILTISKLDNKTLKLEMVPIDLEEFLYEQIQILQGSCAEKKLRAAEPLPAIQVRADAGLLIRVLQNLVSNCLQYAEKEVVVSLSLRETVAEITVEDDGPGIPEQVIPRIFDRFYKGEQGGFGLGLSIAQSGAEYMGGSVSAENKKQPQHGILFRLRLPAAF